MTLKKQNKSLSQKLKDPAAWVVPESQAKVLRRPKLPEIQEIYIQEGPAHIKTKAGTEVRIDAYGNVTIVGQNSLKFKCEGDMEFEADNITMKSKETYRIEGGKHLVQKADRIDLNPKEKV